MKISNKKIIILIFVFLIILLLSISIILANNSSKKTNFKTNKEKIYYEIKYYDTQIIYMINMLNNIEQKDSFYIDWKELQKRTKILHNYWNSAILDLNYLDINKKNLTDFGKNLDNLSVSINNNNKDNTLNNLLNLYQKIITYSESLNDDYYNTLLNIKYNLLFAYSIAEKENWTLTHEYILKSSENISNLLNSIEYNKYTQYNINKAYIAVKELENLINIKDLEVFYFKYHTAINKLNIL